MPISEPSPQGPPNQVRQDRSCLCGLFLGLAAASAFDLDRDLDTGDVKIDIFEIFEVVQHHSC